jgi:hypothetical protein
MANGTVRAFIWITEKKVSLKPRGDLFAPKTITGKEN